MEDANLSQTMWLLGFSLVVGSILVYGFFKFIEK